jgi:hypothetical protein
MDEHAKLCLAPPAQALASRLFLISQSRNSFLRLRRFMLLRLQANALRSPGEGSDGSSTLYERSSGKAVHLSFSSDLTSNMRTSDGPQE